MRQEVTIVQYRFLHYRIALFEEMRIRCADQGIELRLLHGNASAAEKESMMKGVLPGLIG
jgi:hypothetical protein